MKPSCDIADLRSAIRGRYRLHVFYLPGERLIEPHALGYSNDGQLLLRAYQVRGASTSDEHEHWKLMRVDRLLFVQPAWSRAKSPRPGYQRDDVALRGGVVEQI